MSGIGQESGPRALNGIAGYYHWSSPNGLPRLFEGQESMLPHMPLNET